MTRHQELDARIHNFLNRKYAELEAKERAPRTNLDPPIGGKRVALSAQGW